MNRRELIQALLPVPFVPHLVINGKMSSGSAAIPSGDYLLFIDNETVDMGSFMGVQVPDDVRITIIPMKLRHDQTIDDAVRMYKVGR